MDYNFKDKTVIITGGSEGVGAAAARKFAEHGANLVLVARRKRNLEKIAEELRSKTRVEIVAMDVSDADACARNIHCQTGSRPSRSLWLGVITVEKDSGLPRILITNSR